MTRLRKRIGVVSLRVVLCCAALVLFAPRAEAQKLAVSVIFMIR